MRSIECAIKCRGLSRTLVPFCKQIVMGKKKYFCDFCFRLFNDDMNTRNKHLNSVAHIKAKTEHYEMFKDPEIILKENLNKKPCRKFHNDGYCQFGSSCSFSHYSNYELDLLKQEIAKSKMEKNVINIPSTEMFQQKYISMKLKNSSRFKTSMWSHELPGNILSVADSLPPSMQPFNVEIYDNLETDSWG